jgi:hypothetical protein
MARRCPVSCTVLGHSRADLPDVPSQQTASLQRLLKASGVYTNFPLACLCIPPGSRVHLAQKFLIQSRYDIYLGRYHCYLVLPSLEHLSRVSGSSPLLGNIMLTLDSQKDQALFLALPAFCSESTFFSDH